MSMDKLIRDIGEWDEIDDVFYRTGSWMWFNMSLDYLVEKISDIVFWRVVHSYAKPFAGVEVLGQGQKKESS